MFERIANVIIGLALVFEGFVLTVNIKEGDTSLIIITGLVILFCLVMIFMITRLAYKEGRHDGQEETIDELKNN